MASCPWVNPLIEWFRRYGRTFPWRESRNWYEVLIAEVMLVRTRSETVAKVYREFLNRFPTPQDLCRASIEEVESFFKKLGLVNRGRRLRNAVCAIVEQYNSNLPCSEDELLKLDGVGKYIARVLLTQVCGVPKPFVDTNIKRVLSRLTGRELDYSTAEAILLQCVPSDKMWIVCVALLDLAALVCKPRKPECRSCPIASYCAHMMRAS